MYYREVGEREREGGGEGGREREVDVEEGDDSGKREYAN